MYLIRLLAQNRSLSLIVKSCLLTSLLALGPAMAQGLLINDPLNGSTTAAASKGGTFLPGGGWQMTGAGQYLVWAVPTTTNMSKGFFEITVTNFDPAHQATLEKCDFLSGWEGKSPTSLCWTCGDQYMWRVGHYTQFKLKGHQNGEILAEATAAPISGGFKPTATYVFRNEWDGAQLRWLVNGKVFFTLKPRSGNPWDKFYYFALGNAPGNTMGCSWNGPIFSNARGANTLGQTSIANAMRLTPYPGQKTTSNWALSIAEYQSSRASNAVYDIRGCLTREDAPIANGVVIVGRHLDP